jgi:hypothetical protein
VTHSNARVNWYGRDRNWKDVSGVRGENDVELPVGSWNRIEVICEADKLKYFLNGKLVNEADSASLREGKLLFQSAGAEIFFRRIELHPLFNKKE